MMSLLRDIPSRLEDLFAQIISKMSQKQRHASLCIVQWVSGSDFHQHPEALYMALRLGDRPPPATFAEIFDPKVNEYNSKRFSRYVTDTTCGLFEVVEADAIVQYIHQSAKDFIEGPAGLNAYGFASKEAFAEAQSQMMFRSYLSYAHTREIRAAFGNSPDSPFASCSQLIDFCYNGLSGILGLPTQQILIFCFRIVRHSLQQYSRILGDMVVDGVEGSAKQATTMELRRYFESWLYTYCEISRYLFTGRWCLSHLSGATQFIGEHWQRLGISESERQQLMRCLTNHEMVLQHHIDLFGMKHNLSQTAKYHQMFWATTTERPSVIETVENLMKERIAEGSKDTVLEPSIAYEICGRHETEFLCTANFGRLLPGLFWIDWSITEDRQQICELIGVQARQHNATSHPPLYPKGELSLLLRQVDSSGEFSSDQQHTQVVGILEAMFNRGDPLLERTGGRRFRRWTPTYVVENNSDSDPLESEAN
jgi:hypothetical protein